MVQLIPAGPIMLWLDSRPIQEILRILVHLIWEAPGLICEPIWTLFQW